MLREDHPDMSPTTAFRSLSVAPPSPHNANGTAALDDIFGEQSPPRPTTVLSQLDDVFGCSPPTPSLLSGVGGVSIEPSAAEQDVSDIPRLRSIHVTAGYRDGIAESKAEHVQEGFDEGFPLGAVVGLRAGRVVGVLEGVVAAALKAQKSSAAQERAREPGRTATYDAARQLLQDARGQLDVGVLFGPEYFDEQGVWRFAVDGEEDGDDVTFETVAARHPLILKWTAVVDALAKDLSLDLHVLDRRGRGDGDQDDIVEGKAAIWS